jgi:hypothetical protein
MANRDPQDIAQKIHAAEGEKTMNEHVCMDCGETAAELCQDGYCRACHVSLSFDDCTDGTWAVDKLRTTCADRDDELRRNYPDAKQWRPR